MALAFSGAQSPRAIFSRCSLIPVSKLPTLSPFNARSLWYSATSCTRLLLRFPALGHSACLVLGLSAALGLECSSCLVLSRSSARAVPLLGVLCTRCALRLACVVVGRFRPMSLWRLVTPVSAAHSLWCSATTLAPSRSGTQPLFWRSVTTLVLSRLLPPSLSPLAYPGAQPPLAFSRPWSSAALVLDTSWQSANLARMPHHSLIPGYQLLWCSIALTQRYSSACSVNFGDQPLWPCAAPMLQWLSAMHSPSETDRLTTH
jgi:hypothetical protein